jgi:phage tail protein X
VSVTYTARVSQYETISGDLWDLIAYHVYGDEHCCIALQDANYEYRLVDRFFAGVILDCPETVTIDKDLRGPKLPDMKQLQPWRS